MNWPLGMKAVGLLMTAALALVDLMEAGGGGGQWRQVGQWSCWGHRGFSNNYGEGGHHLCILRIVYDVCACLNAFRKISDEDKEEEGPEN